MTLSGIMYTSPLVALLQQSATHSTHAACDSGIELVSKLAAGKLVSRWYQLGIKLAACDGAIRLV